MTAKLIYPVILLFIILFSCAENEIQKGMPEIPEEEEPDADSDTLNIDSTYTNCDSFIAEHIGIGTACCISGYTVAKPGDTATYHYQINQSEAQASWEVLDGDISILTGTDSVTVTVHFGSNFTSGILQVYGSGVHGENRLVCNDHFLIRRE